MNNGKLSSDEVPRKFAEWLLSMGCPSAKVPSVERISDMCRGQYYMVWRSLMEHVEPKDIVKKKRLQVFCDDVQRWQKRSPFNEYDTNTLMPENLALWHRQTELKDKIANIEAQIAISRDKLKHLMDKISIKLIHRDISRKRIEDLQRRIWLLQRVAEDLRTKKENLLETKNIANSLCLIDEDFDAQNKFEQCLTIVRHQGGHHTGSHSLQLVANPVACSSAVSTAGDSNETEEQVSSLVRCPGGLLWPLLCARRAALVTSLTATSQTHSNDVRPTQSYTAALHCTLALEAMKNRLHIKQTRRRLAAAIDQLNEYLSGEACEVLVVQCERTRSEARVSDMRTTLEEMTSWSGVFKVEGECKTGGGEGRSAILRQIVATDKAIESKKVELKRLLTHLATTEKKILNIRECLVNIFNGFQKDMPVKESEKLKGHLDFPQESIASLRQFYEERRETKRNKMELSMNLDASDDCSFTESTNECTRFVDELRIYLKRFTLENNRKLVLDNGEKIWIFETLPAVMSRIYASWQLNEIPPPVSPSVPLSCNIQQLIQTVAGKEMMERMLGELERSQISINIDISSKTKEEQLTIDKIKKRLNENLLSLQKIDKTLDVGQSNMKFWSENEMKKYISSKRTYNGLTYKDYEAQYIETLRI